MRSSARPRPNLLAAAAAAAALALAASTAQAAPPETPEAIEARATAAYWLNGNGAKLRAATPLARPLTGFRASPAPPPAGFRPKLDSVLPVPPKGLGKVYFVTAAGSPRWCSGVSVQSRYRNVVATSGGCAYDAAANADQAKLAFVPDGTATVYVVAQAFTHYDWRVYEDSDREYAFLTVHNGVKADRRAGLTDVGRLGDVAGGQGFAWNQTYPKRVLLRGHPTGWPLRHWVTSFVRGGLFDQAFRGLDISIKGEELLGVRSANPFATSLGSAWLINYDTSQRVGYLNGLTLGLQADTDGVPISVSTYFDGETRVVYGEASDTATGPIV
jgi:hypothetical protein